MCFPTTPFETWLEKSAIHSAFARPESLPRPLQRGRRLSEHVVEFLSFSLRLSNRIQSWVSSPVRIAIQFTHHSQNNFETVKTTLNPKHISTLMEMLLAVPARRCHEGTPCRNGNCGCPDSLPDFCLDVCVDVMSDDYHCGACGNPYENELLPMICIVQ
jgi:hypothetical protein